MKVRTDQVIVGERRREDFGDLDGLTSSIARFGMLHPIVIDIDYNLVAGERRLRAVQQLGWLEVEVRPLGTLSQAERLEIELEENLRRKDLTEYERSRDLVHLAETAATVLTAEAELRPESGRKSRGRPKIPASTRAVADRIGVSDTTIQEAQVYVHTTDAFPALHGWKQYQVLEAKEVLDDLPDSHREKAVALVAQPGIPAKDAISTLRNLAEMDTSERARIFGLAESGDSRDRTAALTEAAKVPPMPDPRLELLDEAKRLLRQALRMFKDDSANSAIAAILPPFDAAYAAIEERARGNRDAA